MKKYVIEIVKKIGSNTSSFMRVNCFETREEWQSALRSLMRAFLVCDCSSKVNYQKVGDFSIAYLSITAE